MNIHAVSHSLPHRGPGASRTRTRWQPYASTVQLPGIQRSPSVYLHTPASSVSSASPPTVLLHPICDLERLKVSHPPPPPIASPLREAQKTKYAAKLVGECLSALAVFFSPSSPYRFKAQRYVESHMRINVHERLDVSANVGCRSKPSAPRRIRKHDAHDIPWF